MNKGFPYNLIQAVSGSKEPPIMVPPDDIISEVMSTLPERISAIVIKHTEYHMTYKEIAEEYSLSVERIRQLYLKGIRMLRHPSRFDKLIYVPISLDDLHRLKEENTYYKQILQDNNWDVRPLSSAKLSIRASNALYRYGIRYIEDILHTDLRCVRNLGTKSFKEVIAMMCSLGYEKEMEVYK